jgi:hypothetical protein
MYALLVFVLATAMYGSTPTLAESTGADNVCELDWADALVDTTPVPTPVTVIVCCAVGHPWCDALADALLMSMK